MARKKELTFREELEKLEDLVSKLESGELELEESLRIYSEGVTLVDSLNRKLSDSKLKITELKGKIEKSDLGEGDE